jgi:hypothetical protein
LQHRLREEEGYQDVHIALHLNDSERLHMLLRDNPDCVNDKTGIDGLTPLLMACSKQHMHRSSHTCDNRRQPTDDRQQIAARQQIPDGRLQTTDVFSLLLRSPSIKLDRYT